MWIAFCWTWAPIGRGLGRLDFLLTCFFTDMVNHNAAQTGTCSLDHLWPQSIAVWGPWGMATADHVAARSTYAFNILFIGHREGLHSHIPFLQVQRLQHSTPFLWDFQSSSKASLWPSRSANPSLVSRLKSLQRQDVRARCDHGQNHCCQQDLAMTSRRATMTTP